MAADYVSICSSCSKKVRVLRGLVVPPPGRSGVRLHRRRGAGGAGRERGTEPIGAVGFLEVALAGYRAARARVGDEVKRFRTRHRGAKRRTRFY